MNLAVTFVSEPNAMVDHHGIPLVRKDIMWYGLAVYTNVFSEITQLFQHLQDIIQHFSMELAGCAV